jgi:hypothetical protein
MMGLLLFVLAILVSPSKSKLRLEAENAVLRHQLNVLTRRLHGRARLTNSDRWGAIALTWTPYFAQSAHMPCVRFLIAPLVAVQGAMGARAHSEATRC